MAEILRPPAVVQPSKQMKSKETLDNSLDELLERYLHLLNQYQTLQQSLSQFLASGYLSLAQANFSNQNRVRYGQDHYDDRMQASARVFISHTTPSFALELRARKSNQPSKDDDNDEVNAAEESTVRGDNRPSQNSENGSNLIRDPLKWFGILVSPALRTSQSKFKDVVGDLVPALASISQEMKEVEIEVRRARKRMKKAV